MTQTHARTGLTALELIRAACAGVRQTLDGDRALTLERAEMILTRMIVDQAHLPAIAARRAASLGGHPEPAAALAADHAYWQDYETAMQAAFAEAAPKPAAPGDTDSIDTIALQRYLRATFPADPNLEVTATKVASRGFSKKTMLVDLAAAPSLPATLALRIDQEFNYLGTTVLEEYPQLQFLWDHGVQIPQPFALEPTGQVLGNPFIVSAKVEGAPIGSLYLPPPPNPPLAAELAAALARLHAVPVANFPGHTDSDNAAAQFLDAEIEKFHADWRALNQTSVTMQAAFDWITQNRALGAGPPSLVHNDYGYNNILIHDNHLSAIVDWEFVHVGTPAADIGYFYYSAEATASYRFFLDAYRDAGGWLPSRASLDFYQLWGQLRLAVMSYQVETGFNAGHFSDIRFGFAGALTLRKALLRVNTKLRDLMQTD